MAKISETELQKRLRKLESEPVASTALVSRVGDQYEYDKDFVYIAYASALASLSANAITNQSDATDFQFSPYNASGTLMAYRGYFINKSIYQSGDPTDYFWESTSGTAGFTSSERYHTTSTGLQESLGNPTKPGTNITWTVIAAGTAVPSTAVYVAERFTITTTAGAITSEWKIKIVGKHIDDTVIKTGGVTTDTIASNAITSAKVTADAITVDKIDLNGTLNVTAASGAIRWGKNDGDDITNSGLFIGRNSSSEPRFSIGTNSSFIWYDGDAVFLVGATVAANNGSIETIINAGNTPYVPSPTKSKVRIEMVGGGGGGGSRSDWGSGQVGDGGDTVVKVQQWNSSTATWSDRGVSWTAGGGQGGISASTTRNGSGGSVGTVGSNSVVYQQSVDANNATINDKPGNGDGGAGAGISISTRTTSVFNGGGGAGGGDAGTTAYSTSSIAGSNGSVGGGGGGAKVYWGYGSNGGGGGSGGYLDILFTNISTTDRILVVSVGAGGSPSTSTGGNGGTGGAGRVRIIGVA